jgi:uncharacterized protein
MSYIITASGKKINIFNPDVTIVNDLEIACSLSKVCRFNGQCSYFYSNLLHSINVSLLCKTKIGQQAALKHEFSEAFYGDVIHPIKYTTHLDVYRILEKQFQKLIYLKDLGISVEPAEVKYADNVALLIESYFLNKHIYYDLLETRWKDLKYDFHYFTGKLFDDYNLAEKEVSKLRTKLFIKKLSGTKVISLFAERYKALFCKELA